MSGASSANAVATAQSIRTLLRVLGTKNGARYNLKVVNTDEEEGMPRQSRRNDLDDAAVETIVERRC